MKKKLITTLAALLAATSFCAQSPSGITYDPSVQPSDMQYFKPAGNQFVGDCIPFYHDGTYYLYWLLDEGHHAALGGLGAHQWAVSTTKDLVNWTHHPIAIGIDEDWEKSICTGSVAYYKGKFYAFYATRLVNGEGKVNEQLSYAVSDDGINFRKQLPNPFYTSAPGYSSRNFRDPKVSVDKDGTFHLFISSEKEQYIFADGRGCLVHLVSKNLKDWEVREPVLSGQRHVPECPDYFEWNGWYYLIYGQAGDTYYVKSRSPYGPWIYPGSQTLVEQWNNVVKTAEFTGNRRIAAGWIPSRHENRDWGGELFGGTVVLRELMQLPDGDLITKFPEEAVPQMVGSMQYKLKLADNAVRNGKDGLTVNAPGAMGGGYIADVPRNCRITLEMETDGNIEEYGLIMRAGDNADGYSLAFSPDLRTIRLHNTQIGTVDGLAGTVKVDILMKDDIIDASVDGRRCIVNRLPEKSGGYLWFYVKQGSAKFRNIKIYPLP